MYIYTRTDSSADLLMIFIMSDTNYIKITKTDEGCKLYTVMTT